MFIIVDSNVLLAFSFVEFFSFMDFYEALFTEDLALSQCENIFISHDFSATCQTSLVGQIFDFVVEYLTHASFSCDTL